MLTGVALKFDNDNRVVIMEEGAYEQIRKLNLVVLPTSHVVIPPSPGKTLLNIGCRHDYLQGYVNIDKDLRWKVDLVYDARLLRNFYKPETVDGIVMTHCFVYLNAWEGPKFIVDAFNMLKPGGMLVLQHPDQEIMCKYILENKGDYAKWLEATRGLHAFDYNEIKNEIQYPPAQMSWPGWALEKVVKEAGFGTTLINIQIPPERPGWRDSVIVGIKPTGGK